VRGLYGFHNNVGLEPWVKVEHGGTMWMKRVEIGENEERATTGPKKPLAGGDC
jgi:hypothetical protein